MISLIISLVQLSSLERAHRYTFWLEMYPLNPKFESRFIGLYHLVSLAARTMYPDDSSI